MFGQAAADWLSTRVWTWTAHALTLEAIEPVQLQTLREVWEQSRDGTGAARLSRFDPGRLGPVLRHVALVDLSEGVRMARYRLVGAAPTKLYGRDLSGRYIAQCYTGEVLAEVLDAYRKVVETGQPLFSTREFQLLGRSFGYRRLLVPLCREGDKVSHAVLGLYPSKRDFTDARQWRSVEEELAFRKAADDREFSPLGRSTVDGGAF